MFGDGPSRKMWFPVLKNAGRWKGGVWTAFTQAGIKKAMGCVWVLGFQEADGKVSEPPALALLLLPGAPPKSMLTV
jgi:hypothetical protein